MNSEDSDPTLATPVKQRGVNFVYNPVQKEVLDMGGFHVPMVPNGSFEGPVSASGVPVSWTASGSGTVSQYLLTQEPGEPEVPSRGTHAMRMVTGNGTNDSISGTSTQIPVTSSTLFTTTSNLRFAWTGDPNPSGPPTSRPQVFTTILYFQQAERLRPYTRRTLLRIFRRTAQSGSPRFQCSIRRLAMLHLFRSSLVPHATGCPTRLPSTWITFGNEGRDEMLLGNRFGNAFCS